MDVLGRMFEATIVTLREGIEVALVVGVLLAYLRRTGREAYTRSVFLGLGAAILMSLLGAVLIQRYGLDPDNPVVEGSVMFVAAALVTSLVIWMWRTGRSVRRRLEHRLDTLVGQAEASTLGYRAAHCPNLAIADSGRTPAALRQVRRWLKWRTAHAH